MLKVRFSNMDLSNDEQKPHKILKKQSTRFVLYKHSATNLENGAMVDFQKSTITNTEGSEDEE